jgi:hypothetical protein
VHNYFIFNYETEYLPWGKSAIYFWGKLPHSLNIVC